MKEIRLSDLVQVLLSDVQREVRDNDPKSEPRRALNPGLTHCRASGRLLPSRELSPWVGKSDCSHHPLPRCED